MSRVISGSDAARRRMGRYERALRSEIGRLGQLAAVCPDAERLALAVDRASARLDLVAIELISDAAHNAEAREALERCAAAVELRAASASFIEAMRQASIDAATAPLLAEIAELRKTAPRSRPARHRKHLRPVPGIPATAVKAAVAAGIVAASVGGAVAMHEESSVRVVAAVPRPVSVRLHAGPADSAVLVPSWSPRAYVRRHAKPSADAASASPVPTPSLPALSAPPSPVPPSQPPAPDVPVLSVARFLDLGDSIRGELTLTAGPGAVTWTATATDGITLSSYGEMLVPGQTVTLQVTDAPADGGWIYISVGRVTYTVHVTSGLGVPVGL